MAYQKTIIKANKNFEGSAWVIYDRCFRRRAAATKSLNWANIDSALYNEAFTGRARVIPRCQSCLSENHTETECPDRPLPMQGQGNTDRVPVPNTERLPHARQSTLSEVCQFFNRARCKAVWCKRRHVCNRCGFPHPEVVCSARSESGNRSRSPLRRKAPKLA